VLLAESNSPSPAPLRPPRRWVFIVGVDTDYRNVATANDTEATLTNLPSGKTAKIQITAVNDAGESGPSAEMDAVIL
jgi:hypothetical protein